MRTRRIAIGTIGLVVAIAALFALRPQGHAPVAPRQRAAAPEIERVPVPAAPSELEPVPPTPPPLAAPRGEVPPDDPCAEPDEDEARISRPSATQVLEARQSELAARSRSLSRASEALREGIHELVLGQDPARAIDRIAAAPDRVDRGFDHAAAAAVHAGLGALADGRPAHARRWAARASALDRRDPAGPVLAFLVADREHDEPAARAALAEAFARDPEDPGVAWQLARRVDRSDLALAATAMRVYLEAVPDDAAGRRHLVRIERQRAAIEDGEGRARSGIVIHAPRGTETALLDRALAIVSEALAASARATGTEVPRELLMIVHSDREAMAYATCAPSWGGAIFDGILHVPRETLLGDERAVRVLRHEAQHAQLHAERRTPLPYWLDEGLAQRFAGEDGVEVRRSWARMVRARMIIPVESIEGPFAVIDDPDDARLAYHQSLAIVRYLERIHGPGAIRSAIARADSGVAPDALLREVAPELDRARLLAFLATAE